MMCASGRVTKIKHRWGIRDNNPCGQVDLSDRAIATGSRKRLKSFREKPRTAMKRQKRVSWKKTMRTTDHAEGPSGHWSVSIKMHGASGRGAYSRGKKKDSGSSLTRRVTARAGHLEIRTTQRKPSQHHTGKHVTLRGGKAETTKNRGQLRPCDHWMPGKQNRSGRGRSWEAAEQASDRRQRQ